MGWSDSGETLKAEWNMDDSVLKYVLMLKYQFIEALKGWQLDDAYWIARQIRMEVEAKFRVKEQEQLAEDILELEQLRNSWFQDKKLKGKFYRGLENFNIILNRLMKKHGLYFREHDDSGL